MMTRIDRPAEIACVYVPDLPFQLSLRDLPEGCRLPAALVDRNDSRAIVLAMNRQAAERGIYPGLSYANAIGLCPNLHATCPHPQQMNQINGRLIHLLGLFSPAVEPVDELLGAYYLDVRGMTRLEPSLGDWGRRLQETLLEKEKLKATVVIGFTRFGTRTVVSSASDVVFFSTPENELNAAFATPLDKLGLPEKPLKELEKLNVHTVGELQSFPAWEVRSRFAEPMFELVRKAKERDSTVHGIKFPEPYAAQIEFDYTESSAERLVATIQHLCEPLLEKMKSQDRGVSTIHIHLMREDRGVNREKIKTVKPTAAMATLVDLLRLRLHAIRLNEGVTRVAVQLIPEALPDPQLNLYPALIKSEQTLLRANRAIARIEAEFGMKTVVRAKCRPSHLPKDSFRWECFDELRYCRPMQPTHVAVIRRFLDQPKHISTPHQVPQLRILGPYSTSGFWWRENSVQRNDYFVENPSGNAQWVFYDRNSRQWYAQGFVQ